MTTTTTAVISSTVQQADAAGHRAAATYSAFANSAATDLVSILITAAFIVGIVIIIMKTGWLRARLERIDDVLLKSDRAKKFVEKSWEEVERHFFSGNDNDLKIAVIKADTLLGEALREAGTHGVDLGDRLKKLTAAELPNIENVWEAHKLRNRIAHEIDFVLKRDLAERALTVYEQALEYLGVLPEMTVTGSGSSKLGPGSGSAPQNHSPR